MGWKVKPTELGKELDRAIRANHSFGRNKLEQVIHRRSPVDTGAFDADWYDHVEREPLYTVFENHMKYAQKLENGASNENAPFSVALPKAPNGIARVSTIEVAPYIEGFGLKLKRFK